MAPVSRSVAPWFAGGDGRVLATVPSEISFFSGLGMWVVGMSLVSGFGMTVAAAEWWNTTMNRVIWVMPVWAVLYCLIERLVLKSFGTDWRWNLGLSIPRGALALSIALVVGLPVSQIIYSRSISDQLSQTATVRTQQATRAVRGFFEPKIAAARADIAAIRGREARLQAAATNETFLSQCEAGEVQCSQTHELGCGPYCKRDASRAATARSELSSVRRSDATAIRTDEQNIADWQVAEQRLIAGRSASIASDRDFLARQAALDAIEKKHKDVRRYVDFFLAFLVSLDLVALAVKLMHLFSTGGAYEQNAAALREFDAVESHRLREEARVLKRRISEQARADEEIDVARIHAMRDRRITEEEAKASEWRSRRPRAERVVAGSLEEYVSNTRSHESQTVDVPRGLRLAGLIGTALVLALAIVVFLVYTSGGGLVPGAWVAVVLCIAVLALAGYTRGFRAAAPWALRATFLTLLLGLLLPVFLLVVNVF